MNDDVPFSATKNLFSNFPNQVYDIIVTVTLYSLATISAIVIAAAAEKKSIFSPMNAIGQIIFGDDSIGKAKMKAQCSLSGLLLNFGAMIGWAAVAGRFYKVFRIVHGYAIPIFLVSISITMIANITDFRFVPNRFTLGFERR